MLFRTNEIANDWFHVIVLILIITVKFHSLFLEHLDNNSKNTKQNKAKQKEFKLNAMILFVRSDET